MKINLKEIKARLMDSGLSESATHNIITEVMRVILLKVVDKTTDKSMADLNDSLLEDIKSEFSKDPNKAIEKLLLDEKGELKIESSVLDSIFTETWNSYFNKVLHKSL